MTFDEWYEANVEAMHIADFKPWMSEAWDAAVLAEREACAKLCEQEGRASCDDYEAGGMFECAAAIRARGK